MLIISWTNELKTRTRASQNSYCRDQRGCQAQAGTSRFIFATITTTLCQFPYRFHQGYFNQMTTARRELQLWMSFETRRKKKCAYLRWHGPKNWLNVIINSMHHYPTATTNNQPRVPVQFIACRPITGLLLGSLLLLPVDRRQLLCSKSFIYFALDTNCIQPLQESLPQEAEGGEGSKRNALRCSCGNVAVLPFWFNGCYPFDSISIIYCPLWLVGIVLFSAEAGSSDISLYLRIIINKYISVGSMSPTGE